MDGFKQINILDYVSALKTPDNIDEYRLLPEFSCPLNPDIEDFFKHKALEFDKQSISRTTMVFTSFKEKPVLVGYFTLANKIIVVRQGSVSGTLWKRIKKFGSVSRENKTCAISAPLIGQLGKNYINGYNGLISGDELLQMAIDQVKISQSILGGKVVYLECEDNAKLIDFYERNGFFNFNHRTKDSDETNINGEYLIQMLSYL